MFFEHVTMVLDIPELKLWTQSLYGIWFLLMTPFFKPPSGLLRIKSLWKRRFSADFQNRWRF
jgi:hypothetical protein